MSTPDNPPEPIIDKEAKAEVLLSTTWLFRLNKTDALLMLRALSGRLKDKELADANELGQRLTLLRAQSAREQLDALIRAEQYALNPKEPS